MFRFVDERVRARGGKSSIIHDCPGNKLNQFHVPLAALGGDESVPSMVKWVTGLWQNASSVDEVEERYLNAYGVFQNPARSNAFNPFCHRF